MYALVAHPDRLPGADLVIGAELTRSDEGIRLRYILTGDVAALTLPEAAEPGRADNLWQTTCFEMFVGRPGERAYLEYNLAPSSKWAAYRFCDYREGMGDVVEADPAISVTASADRLELVAGISLPDGWRTAQLDICLAAVIDEADGTKSYWALRHPPGKPDFHHADCFALHLAAGV